jgi:3-isopropylmalate/(R)-2-methylmalate dehydratase large subunit
MHETDQEIFSAGGKTVLVRDYLHDLLLGEKKRPEHYVDFSSQVEDPKTIVEKIVSSHVHEEVSAGDDLEDVPIDTLYISDAFGPAVIEEFQNNFDDIYEEYDVSNKVFDPERVFFIVDHDSPPCSPKSSEGVQIMRDFSREQELKFYKPGDGIEHVVLMEDGYIAPGSIVIATDSHTCTNGALNALSFGIGTTEATYALSTGFLHYFRVPETIRINLRGEFKKGVYAKDFVLYLLGLLGVSGAHGKVLEFGGEGLSDLSIESRATISNMAVEMGARGSLFEYDEVTEKYLEDRSKFKHKHFNPDEGCKYVKNLAINLSDLEPCVAFPHKPDNVTFVSQIKEYMEESRAVDSTNFPAIKSLKITNGFLGACTNGKYEDFVEAAKIIKGRRVPEDVDFVVIPASRKIYNKLLKEGILEIFAEAGANIESSTCGPCYGRHKGVVGSQSQIISSSNRNFIGRMGSKGSKIFLASPVTVTASVLEGKITDPRKYLP